MMTLRPTKYKYELKKLHQWKKEQKFKKTFNDDITTHEIQQPTVTQNNNCGVRTYAPPL